MNSASNMMAKWYQKDCISGCPKMSVRMCDIPNASVGAPPVLEMMVCSPTAAAALVSCSGIRLEPGSPREFTNSAALSGFPPVMEAGAFIAKYT